MIEHEYIELMNGEIDGVNTPEQSARLRRYLAERPEARRYQRELQEALGIFAKAGEVPPPTELRQKILTAAERLTPEDAVQTAQDAAQAAPQPAPAPNRSVGHTSIRPGFLNTLRAQFQPGHAYALAAGILLGVCALALVQSLLPAGHDGRVAHFLGTMGQDTAFEADLVSAPLAFSADDISGKVQIFYLDEEIRAHLEIDSGTPVRATFETEGIFCCSGYWALDNIEHSFESTAAGIAISQSGTGRYEIGFCDRDRRRFPVHVRISRGEEAIFDQSIEPRRDQ